MSTSTVALPTTADLRERALDALLRCGVRPEATWAPGTGPAGSLTARTPITGGDLRDVAAAGTADIDAAVAAAHDAFGIWRKVPAPLRGVLVRRLAELLRDHRQELADLVTVEAGKIRSEALGEVQEMIDVCEFAVGLSRQLYGRTMPSERPGHRMMETWHPLGVVGLITAFNFPVAVWAWNTAIALVCGDTVVWKPSELTPLTALACTALLERAAADSGAPHDVHRLVLGDGVVGQHIVDSPRIALVSATGSTRMGRSVGPRVAARFGRSILELGGNNAAVVTGSADLDLTAQSIVFAAAGTAGQRCTTLRRLIVHADVADALTEKLRVAYGALPIGDPFAGQTLVGPLINADSYQRQRAALDQARRDGGEVLAGGSRRLADTAADAYYVEPALVRMPAQTDVVREETFAPILYVLTYHELDEAIALHNAVPQGLSSSIFTRDQAEAERFLAADGSDCGIANVNIGTSGAEIGGAFGGEKETGGGRESGSDAWRAYMRRATNTVNYSGELRLAQNVSFTG
ncbi:L-piperidine-6-carboxylate dehydrogenase [Phytohabitans rumicis]|uniref:aldehyde dehydrogenase (NAD(+)) n=1 Tax=Phytohabitans rumicis TaxID=1076125 RepID=A0A6V8LKI9_9ACTN|nr:aldehyde dehydrogenase family protein [Phytohabitans rumicis]GFJ95398.1 aldehyde dehydrogenase [Phytohabitans rumicis]